MISKVKPLVHDSGDKKEWFETWFDSPYYHILYKNRDDREAEAFLDQLISYLNPAPGAKILDVACGRGRHAVYLNKKGFDVTGFDLSENNIEFVKDFENDHLQFFLHDMREIFRVNYYDIVINLFSSFGYFEKERDNQRCLIANATALKPGGIFVFDYFNSENILRKGNSKHAKVVDGIEFNIQKEIHGNVITKHIDFNDQGKSFHFEEQLILSSAESLKKYVVDAGLKIIDIFGCYTLKPFDPETSERLIIISQK